MSLLRMKGGQKVTLLTQYHWSGRNLAAVQTENLSSPRRESNICKWSGGRPSLPFRMAWKMACRLSSQVPLACPLSLSPSDPAGSLKGDIVVSLWGSIEGEGCPICLLTLIAWKRGGTTMTEKELAEQLSYPGPSRGWNPRRTHLAKSVLQPLHQSS